MLCFRSRLKLLTLLYVREISELVPFYGFPVRNYPQHACKMHANAKPRKRPQIRKRRFWVRGSPKTRRNHLERPTRPKLPGNQNAYEKGWRMNLQECEKTKERHKTTRALRQCIGRGSRSSSSHALLIATTRFSLVHFAKGC